MKRTILKGMVRFYLYRMKNQDISAKLRLYHQKKKRNISTKNSNISAEIRIYHRKLEYIDETADISAKLRLYHQKTGFIDEKQQYISENQDISPKHL
ncbi:hypothetical protein ACIQY5_20325 [Peribacillus frigoritolerans]|uniref:hypothetical protein n=1 Tax=Peribacillus frigoritolerans TaxID=450367 RepID=UPI0037FB9315